MSKKDAPKQEVGTTGHEWDGIEELNNPLPRWWLWTFYATCLWGIAYTVAYPAWPMLKGATAGWLGYSTRAEVQGDIDAVTAANAEISAKLANADLATLAVGDPVHTFGINQGEAVFKTFCAQCHGAGAGGAKGFPNLLDDDWLWGGDVAAIEQTVRYGVRSPLDETRYSEMPKFGELLEPADIDRLAQFVLKLAGQDHDADMAAAGAVLFVDNGCNGCHGDAGEGNRDVGAPNLSDAIWLYGSDVASVTESISQARFGVMPNWAPRLNDAQIKAVTLYVHGLGGGE